MTELLTAFGLGNTAIINNVCLLPLYPGLVAFLAGNAEQKRARMGLLGVIVLAGVLTMMLVVALLLHLFNAVTNDVLPILLPIIYGVVLLMGGMMILGYNPWARLQTMKIPALKNPYATAFVYGLLLGPMTLPCVAPLIVSAFALGANDAGELIDGLLYFLAFGLGFGWPLAVLPLVAVQSQRRFISWMTSHHTVLTRAAGVLLVAIGLFGFVTEVLPSWQEAEVDAGENRWAAGRVLTDHQEAVNALTFVGEERLISGGGVGNSGLFASGTDFALREWDTAAGTVVNRFDAPTNSTEVLVSNGEWWAAGGWYGSVLVWRGDVLVAELAGHTTRVIGLAFNPAGTRLATGSEAGLVQVWAIDDGTVSAAPLYTVQHPRLTTVALSETALATGGMDHTIRRWDAASGEAVGSLDGHSSWISALAFDASGGRLVSGSVNGELWVWDVATLTPLARLSFPAETISAAAFSEHYLAVGGGQRVVVWRVEDLTRPVITFRDHSADVQSVAFNADGSRLASADAAGEVWTWEAP